MASAFDPQAFLDAQITEPNERRANLPVDNPDAPDGLYTAVIGEVSAKSGAIGKGDRIGQPWLSMVVPLRITIPAQVQNALKLPAEITLTDNVFIDLTPEGLMDNAPGRNRRQKEYRDALDLNKAGTPFSWRATTGRVVKVKVKQEMYDGLPQDRVATILRAA